ncbi:MAG: Smr/MutS family protein [Burkholderiales bacterium]
MAEDDDLDAFREAVKGVAPLKAPLRVEVLRPRPAPVPVQSLLEDRAVLADSLADPLDADAPLDIGEELTYRREGIPAQALRKLRRGEWSIQGDLDLHHQTVDEARALLVDFLNRCVKRGVRCVRIVHGKGYRSAGGHPVLKGKVAHWLRQRDEVLAYVQARAEDGGGGALLVLLRGSRPAPMPEA